MKLKFGIAAMMIAACAVAFSACDSDEPGANTDPETPETPIDPEEPNNPEEPEFPTGPAEPLTDEIRPVLTDGKKWEFKVFTKNKPEGSSSSSLFVQGDTAIKGVLAKRICAISDNNPQFLMREVDGVVSSYWKIEDSEIPDTYDFLYSYDIDPQEGEFLYGSPTNILIMSKGTIELMGKTRRAVLVKDIRFYGQNYFGAYIYDLWIEGIGPLFGTLLWHQFILPSTPLYNWWSMHYLLLECYDGDEKIYDYREFTPERYKPEVVFHEPDADAYEIMNKMSQGIFANEYINLFGY